MHRMNRIKREKLGDKAGIVTLSEGKPGLE
jgi:hypothetical protein